MIKDLNFLLKDTKFLLDDDKFKITRLNVLLKSTGCLNRGNCVFCSFSDYYDENINSCIQYNNQELFEADLILGHLSIGDKKYKDILVELAPSASFFEIPNNSQNYCFDVIRKNDRIAKFRTEVHYYYGNLIKNTIHYLNGALDIKIGIETFNDHQRAIMGKDYEIHSYKNVLRYTDKICLIGGIKGQTKEAIIEDIKIAKNEFQYTDWNLIDEAFVKNKNVIDWNLRDWLINEIIPDLDKEPNIKVWNNSSDFVNS